MILSSETISKRNNFPVELQCRLYSAASREIEWGVKYARQSQYFDSFEDATEYIRKRKFLSPKKLESFGGTKEYLLREARTKLAELDRIEAIRNTAEYQEARQIYEVREQLKTDLCIPYSRDVDNLIMLYYLKEINKNLCRILQEQQNRGR